MADDLIARLRAVENGGSANSVTHWYRNPDGPEAAERIEQLEAEVAKLYRLLTVRDNFIASEGLFSKLLEIL
jgi:hypothetical protein